MTDELEIVEGEIVEGEIVEEGAELATAPEPLVRVRASIYEGPKGGLVLALEVEGVPGTHHRVLPAATLRVAARVFSGGQLGGGQFTEILRGLRARRGAA